MENLWQSRLRSSVGDSKLWRSRRQVMLMTARDFMAVAKVLLRPIEEDEESEDAIHAVGLLLQMSGELASAAGRLLSDGEHYAGAALVRQVVEIEYLTWTFKEGHRSASKWLQSTHDERMKMFSPRELRKTSKGRFLSRDYQHHCEQGGHPVPVGSFLLSAQSPSSAQMLLVDLIVHCWRTWDQIVQWSKDLPVAAAAVLDEGNKISARLNDWGVHDPMYALMVEKYPEQKS
ncbi:MAG TPA: hypothetical protein VN843_30355 [Anaerolineales bacterium]|nr:hypothetical protein [Anaerolineales bacterium]